MAITTRNSQMSLDPYFFLNSYDIYPVDARHILPIVNSSGEALRNLPKTVISEIDENGKLFDRSFQLYSHRFQPLLGASCLIILMVIVGVTSFRTVHKSFELKREIKLIKKSKLKLELLHKHQAQEKLNEENCKGEEKSDFQQALDVQSDVSECQQIHNGEEPALEELLVEEYKSNGDTTICKRRLGPVFEKSEVSFEIETEPKQEPLSAAQLHYPNSVDNESFDSNGCNNSNFASVLVKSDAEPQSLVQNSQTPMVTQQTLHHRNKLTASTMKATHTYRDICSTGVESVPAHQPKKGISGSTSTSFYPVKVSSISSSDSHVGENCFYGQTVPAPVFTTPNAYRSTIPINPFQEVNQSDFTESSECSPNNVILTAANSNARLYKLNTNEDLEEKCRDLHFDKHNTNAYATEGARQIGTLDSQHYLFHNTEKQCTSKMLSLHPYCEHFDNLRKKSLQGDAFRNTKDRKFHSHISPVTPMCHATAAHEVNNALGLSAHSSSAAKRTYVKIAPLQCISDNELDEE